MQRLHIPYFEAKSSTSITTHSYEQSPNSTSITIDRLLSAYPHFLFFVPYPGPSATPIVPAIEVFQIPIRHVPLVDTAELVSEPMIAANVVPIAAARFALSLPLRLVGGGCFWRLVLVLEHQHRCYSLTRQKPTASIPNRRPPSSSQTNHPHSRLT